MRDLYNNTTVKVLLAAKRRFDLADLSETGTTVDLAGEARKCLLLVNVGDTATATLNIVIQESTDSTTFTTLKDTIYITTGTEIADLTPTKRYIRAVAYLSSTNAAAVDTYVDFAVGAVLYNERYRPSNVA